MICCGTSPLRCSAKLSWVKTATELMVGLVPTHNPGEPLKWEGVSQRTKSSTADSQYLCPLSSEFYPRVDRFTSKLHLIFLTYASCVGDTQTLTK